MLAGCGDDPSTTASAPSTSAAHTGSAAPAPVEAEPAPSTEPPRLEPAPAPGPAQPAAEPAATAHDEPNDPDAGPETVADEPVADEPVGDQDAGQLAPSTTVPVSEPEADDDERPVLSLLAGTGERAPEWPFRGMVWAFSQDVDGDDRMDLIVQYHNTSDRSFTELAIGGFDSRRTLCFTGMLVTEAGLAVFGRDTTEPPLVIPWGEPPTQDQAIIDEVLSLEDLAGFRRQSMSLGLVRASVVSSSAGRWLQTTGAGTEYSLHFGFPHSDPDGYVYPAFLRGSDGEFLAVAFTEPGGGGLCDRQHTYVISMKTGEVVACGYHEGHLGFVTPPGDGLLVEHIKMPSAGFFTPESCRLPLKESPLWPASPTEIPGDSLAGYLAGLPLPSDAAPDQPDEPEEPQEDEQPEPVEQSEPVEPAPEPEVVVRGSPAPPWPFRGLVEVDYDWGEGDAPHTLTIRYLSSRARSVTEMVVEGLESMACGQASIGVISEAGVTVDALWNPREGPGGYVTLAIPWGGTPTVVIQGPLPEADASWQDLLPSAYSIAHGYVVGGSAFDVSIHANGLRLLAGEAAESYQYETWGSGFPDGEEGPPPESVELYGDALSTFDGAYFLGTDGEFAGFATFPYEPACAPATGYLVSMRTGEAFACGFAADGIALVQPPQEGLLVEEVSLPDNRRLREQCSNGNLAERWASLPQPPAPYPPKPPPAEPILPTQTAPQWPFRGAVLALQRYVPQRFSYETVLQYHSSEDGSVTELVFGPMRDRSRDLAIEADEHGVEVRRRDWAVRVPWGDTAEPVDIESAAARPARTTAYPTRIAFGLHETQMEVESFITQRQVSRLTVGPYWAGGQQSWYIWSAPDDSMINTPLDIRRQHSGQPFWLRGTDGRVMAISQQDSSEMCSYACDPVLTVLMSLETGQVLSCGIELDGANALVFVAPSDSSITPDAKLPPSGWLDLSGCYGLFELIALPDDTAVTVVPAWIQADLARHQLLIQPAVGE